MKTEESSIDSASERDGFLSDGETIQRRNHWTEIHVLSWLAQILLFVTSLAFLYKSSQMSCVKKHSVYSPVLDLVHEDYEKWQFNGTFRSQSPYKGPPSPEVDRAWSEIVDVGIMSISHHTLEDLGRSENSVRLPPESGGGYMASLEVHHQIHCVNLLWQGTYMEYYKNRSISFTDSAHTVREHLDHCADLLRQKLMCVADVGIITYEWVKGHKYPYPNFNTVHKCRNFDDILQWSREQQAQAPDTAGGWVERFDEVVELELPP